MVPLLLGFHPEHSLVLVTLDQGGTSFAARVDLPDDEADLVQAVATVVGAGARNGAVAAFVVIYTDDECLAAEVAETVSMSLDAHDVRALRLLRADGRRWFPLDDPEDLRSWSGESYDVRDHALTTNAVLEGRVTFRNRAELRDSLAITDPDVVETVSAAAGELDTQLGPLGRASPEDLVAEGQWLVARIEESVPFGHLPDEHLARVLRALRVPDLRDLAWATLTRADAGRHVTLWRGVVRRCPEELIASAAALLGFVAWLDGEGALAWCAVDRALQAEPDHSMARLVADCLESALPPSAWRPVDPRTLRLYAG